MNRVLILKTNIESKQRAKTLAIVFDKHESISSWSIDLDDVDKVLRIEASPTLSESDVQQLMASKGYFCEDLAE
ncbi:MAG: hypothetical protein KDC83_09075 [Flavobacteriales bacterium]|nr:hypothetical protein [Flavobacteriales bacterium]